MSVVMIGPSVLRSVVAEMFLRWVADEVGRSERSLVILGDSVMTELEEGNAACRQEAAWVFFNMCQCGFEVHERLIPILVQHGVLSAVCHNLDRQEEPGACSGRKRKDVCITLVT